ncbi:phosphatidylinositol phosphatase PTPRQ [Anopheles nili]|uniref:phosphatidylinositol phosphatase PTPRQ n=1 Tax=Anopheles nili TaxID=185578 RepID=UPI00237B944C|nr:phosphatidylinositol phosphatase PTPRQ [Anopheles nili]
MVQLLIILGVLLGSGWTLPQEEIVIIGLAMEANGVSKPSLREAPINELPQPTPEPVVKSCDSANVSIVVMKSTVNVPEWSGLLKSTNVSYEVQVLWLNQYLNRSEKNKRLKSSSIRDLKLPVQDLCNIRQLTVCQFDLRSYQCTCASWTPPTSKFNKFHVHGSDRSYALGFHTSNSRCLKKYVVFSECVDVNVTAPFVSLENMIPCREGFVKVDAIVLNEANVSSLVQVEVYPEAQTQVENVVDVSVPKQSRAQWPSSENVTVSKIDDVWLNTTVCYDPVTQLELASCSNVSVTNRLTKMTKEDVTIATKVDAGVLPFVPPICPVRPTLITGEASVKPQAVGPVRDLRANTDLDRTVVLTWRPPIEGTQCIKEYVITWASESRTIDASNTTYFVTNLEPCTTYEFTVNSNDHINEKGTPNNISATVRELQQLSEVTELELYEVEPRSLSVKWKPPINGTNCVQSYRVAAWYNSPETAQDVTVFSNTTNDQHVTFGEVIACMVYTVQVIPISFKNNDGRNEIGSLKTKERTILSYHVEPVRAVSVKSRSLELSTLLHSENNNNCLLVSVRFNCTMLLEGEPDPTSQVVKEFVIPNTNVSFEGIVEPLVPFSMYQCNAQIQNIAGWSDPTPAYEFQTADDVPESPSVKQLTGNNRSIEIVWEAPAVKNGIVVRYRIHVRMIAPEYPLPKLCAPLEEFNETVDLRDEVSPDEARSWDGVEFQHSVTKLNPYTLYTVQVAAATGAGFGPYTDPEEVVTQPDVSNVTASFRIEEVVGPELDQPYQSSVRFVWDLPCGLHGKLKRFNGLMHGIREQDASIPHVLAWEVNVGEDEEIQDTYSYTEDRLKPEYNYTVSMSVEVVDVEELSQDVKLQFESPAGIPTIDYTEEWFNVNVFEAPNPTNTARIVLGNLTLTSDIGSIRYMALLISERLCQQDPEPRTDFINSTGATQWPDVSDWYRANNMRCVEQYQTTPKFWNPMARSERATRPVEYVIGKETCDKGQEYCNGPLKPGTEYALIVRIFSRSGFTDSAMQVFKTDSLIKVGLIVSAIAGCLLLAFIGGLVVFWRKQRLLQPAQQTNRAPVEEPVDITLKSFPNQYDELFQSNREKVSKEFQAINYFSDVALQETISFQSAKENERKNRYVNILPFDTNRVLLDSNDDDDGSVNDYINASFVEGYKYQREYIATQGPKHETCFDFWRMVLQYEIESIVMLTQPIDHDKNKCYQYFPRFDKVAEFGDIRVKCTQELNLSLYFKRLFLVSKGNLTKPVFHYHFLDWPDHSCPSSPADLIKFSKIVRAERKSYAIPLVVHCSAGVGRTGTFIALDIILQRMQHEKKINVYDTVKRLRRQRVKMVQTLDQYSFLYQCCLEYVSKSNRKKPKTSSIEVIRRDDKGKRFPDVIVEMDQQVSVGSGGKPLFNIKFPRSVNSGLGNVTSFAPSDIGDSGDK